MPSSGWPLPEASWKTEDPSSPPHPSLSLSTPPLLKASLSLTVKEPGIQTRAQQPLSDTGLPPSRSVGFLNKVTLLAATPHLLDALACPCAASRVSVDLVTL